MTVGVGWCTSRTFIDHPRYNQQPTTIIDHRHSRCFPAGVKPPWPQVLLTTGAMNPPHKGHAQLLRQAKERLESAGYQVGCPLPARLHGTGMRDDERTFPMLTFHWRSNIFDESRGTSRIFTVFHRSFNTTLVPMTLDNQLDLERHGQRPI